MTVEAFIDRLSPADRVAVVGFGTGAKSTTFVSDHDQLKRALALLPGQQQQTGVGGGTHDLGIAAALAIDRGDDITLSQVVMRDCQGTQRAIQLCRQEIQAEAQQVAAEARLASDLTLRSLRDVLTNLKAVDAPKTLLLVSQGFLADNQRDDVTRITEISGLAAAARTSIYAFRLESNPADVTRARGSINPSLLAEDRRERRNGLEALTSSARGTLFDVAGTGASVFERVTNELSGYYLLGVEPDARDRDGKPHPIRVDVGRNGLTVRAHRTMMSGGAAGTAAASRTPREIVTAALSSPLPAASLPLRAIAFTFRGLEAGKVRLLVHADIGSAYTTPQRLAIGYYVVDRDGKNLDGQVSEVRLAPLVPGVPSPVAFSGGASVDPGDYTVKIAVADGDRIGSLDLPVHASLLDLGKVQLTELIAGGPVPPVNLLRPSVGTVVSFGTVHGYLEAYGPDSAMLGVRFDVAAEERGPAILSADVQGQIVGDERVVFSQTVARTFAAARIVSPSRDHHPGQHAADNARARVRDRRRHGRPDLEHRRQHRHHGRHGAHHTALPSGRAGGPGTAVQSGRCPEGGHAAAVRSARAAGCEGGVRRGRRTSAEARLQGSRGELQTRDSARR